jgi:FkbM family methyltransferase
VPAARRERQRALCIDIGANYGQSVGSISAVLNAPHIVAFEPNPVAYEHLAKIAGVSKSLSVHHCALGEQPGRLNLYIPSCARVTLDQFASTTPVQTDRMVRAFVDAGFTFAATSPIQVMAYEVEVRRLDDFDLAPDFVKIDVEGGELAVLRGAVWTLNRSRPVLMIENGERPELMSWLKERSYQRYIFTSDQLTRTDSAAALNSFYIHVSRQIS